MPFTEGCNELDANDSCIITRDVQESLDIALIKDIKITNLEFVLVE
jgi:hypothetical protein